MHRFIGCFIFLILTISCGKKANEKKNVFYLNYSAGTVESLDPAFAKNLYNMWTDHMLYNTLVETDEHLNIIPSLAKKWEVSPDGLTYTFSLRRDVFFHDDTIFSNGKGRRMEAQDVVYSFNRLIDPSVASTGAWIFNERIASKEPFTALNDSTIVVQLKTPFRPLLQIFTMPYCSIVPKEAVLRWGKDFGRHPLGTGPFVFHYWDDGNVLALKRNEHYWERDATGLPLPYLDAVQISFVDSKATEFFLFLQGKIDFVNNIDGSFKDLVLTKGGELQKAFQHKIVLTKRTYLNTEYIGFLVDTTNKLVRHSPTRFQAVRKAINFAIDRERIARYFKNGTVRPATEGFIPRGMPGYDSNAHFGYHYDPKKALSLLKEAGFPNGQGLRALTILAPDNWADIVNFIAVQLQEIGIQAKVEIIQANILRQQMSKSEAIAFRAQWIADYPDAESMLAFFYGKLPAPPNYTRFHNVLFDKMYDVSMNTPDSIRFLLYQKMDSLAMSEAPIIPLFYDQMLHFTHPDVQGFSANSMNLIDLKRVQKKQ
ncbi:MAG: ABC transporter substrate-binding protein [Bacteroidetes bacterium]|nr:ABC transporter substrate-binding protein [Bacteroidota bacterium]MBS1740038.1 ABC transporter substrate-binding protein [Bacteroidota bacterium]